jgi:hypothetical protein
MMSARHVSVTAGIPTSLRQSAIDTIPIQSNLNVQYIRDGYPNVDIQMLRLSACRRRYHIVRYRETIE